MIVKESYTGLGTTSSAFDATEKSNKNGSYKGSKIVKESYKKIIQGENKRKTEK